MKQRARAAAGPSVADATELFHAARFEEAAQALKALRDSKSHSAGAALLLARIRLRRGSTAAALAVLEAGRNAGDPQAGAETAMLRGVAYARLGDAPSARAQFEAATGLLAAGDALHSELIYHRAAADWIERRLERASRTLELLPAALDSDLGLQVGILRGAIASANENLSMQGAILLDTLAHARLNPGHDVYLHAMLVTQIAALSVELPSKELRDASIDELPTVRWTADIGDLHFHTLRAIGWRHALDGDEFNAFRRLKEAVAVTPSAPWRVAALADRAYLATALDEPRWGAQELRDAHELAGNVDWAAVSGEEKLALPTLAELFSTQDPPVAIHYAATFKSVGANYPRVLSSRRDRRVTALETYAFGKVQAGLGEAVEGKRLLTQAWEIYTALGIQWRAARAALALAALPDGESWRAKAVEALRNYPRCWLSRAALPQSRTRATSSPELERLTTAQRTVFDLLMAGCSTADISARLGRSPFTVRNHIKKIFKLFGATSRAALIVRASSGN